MREDDVELRFRGSPEAYRQMFLDPYGQAGCYQQAQRQQAQTQQEWAIRQLQLMHQQMQLQQLRSPQSQQLSWQIEQALAELPRVPSVPLALPAAQAEPIAFPRPMTAAYETVSIAPPQPLPVDPAAMSAWQAANAIDTIAQTVAPTVQAGTIAEMTMPPAGASPLRIAGAMAQLAWEKAPWLLLVAAIVFAGVYLRANPELAAQFLQDEAAPEATATPVAPASAPVPSPEAKPASASGYPDTVIDKLRRQFGQPVAPTN